MKRPEKTVEKTEFNLSSGGIVDDTKTEMKFSFFRCCRILIEGISELRKTYCFTLIDLAFSPFLWNISFAESERSTRQKTTKDNYNPRPQLG